MAVLLATKSLQLSWSTWMCQCRLGNKAADCLHLPLLLCVGNSQDSSTGSNETRMKEHYGRHLEQGCICTYVSSFRPWRVLSCQYMYPAQTKVLDSIYIVSENLIFSVWKVTERLSSNWWFHQHDWELNDDVKWWCSHISSYNYKWWCSHINSYNYGCPSKWMSSLCVCSMSKLFRTWPTMASNVWSQQQRRINSVSVSV